jgi:hypothetical protein
MCPGIILASGDLDLTNAWVRCTAEYKLVANKAKRWLCHMGGYRRYFASSYNILLDVPFIIVGQVIPSRFIMPSAIR